MDISAIKKIVDRDNPMVFVPAGDKKFIEKRTGSRLCKELSWWQSLELDRAKVTFLPAIHWSGRSITTINRSLWGSWLLEFHGIKIFFAGDTAFGEHFDEILEYAGKIDIAMLPIGPNFENGLVEPTHMSFKQSVEACEKLKAKIFIPIHWGVFKMSPEEKFDPVLKVLSTIDEYQAGTGNKQHDSHHEIGCIPITLLENNTLSVKIASV
jgi:L-ascorbate metabolism protein UlaG (beta-lactamase superfamily)